ncbi:MAG TPA: hypothetical protein DHW42_01825, partial [Candidatus Marinimicrobia bacterium]|nr:hypothetical protein [Candidatus Neomarinimicrobiota bacterium]
MRKIEIGRMIFKKHTFCLLMLLISSFLFDELFAENIVIEATVVDSIYRRGISDVNVFIQGTSVGTITDQHGKFTLVISEQNANLKLVFSHIAYSVKIVPVSYFDHENIVLLREHSIRLREIEVQTKRPAYEYSQEITNIISAIPSEIFDSKGFADVADILIADQSAVIEERANGVKTVSIRGANQDEVLVLYNGIRLNGSFDNLFDLSLIDPSGLQQIDIIKGSNIATFGSLGSSAAINFVPKLKQDYLMKFYQRVGTYNSGDWGLNLSNEFHGLKFYAGIKEAAWEQRYIENQSSNENIEHQTSNVTLNLSYSFGKGTTNDRKHTVQSFYLQSERDYNNHRDMEKLGKFHKVQSIKYINDFEKYGKVNLNISDQILKESRLNSYLL